MHAIHYRYATVQGQRLFYREAGPAGAGRGAAARLPGQLVHVPRPDPAAGRRYHVIAPDHLGFGLSDAPPADEFGYTFDALADLTAGCWTSSASPVRDVRPGLRRPGRLAARPAPPRTRSPRSSPRAATATTRGFTTDSGSRCGSSGRTAPADRGRRPRALTLDVTRWQYLHGVPDETLVSPDTWLHDFAQLSRPGNDEISWPCSPTTPPTCRCTPSCTPGCATARSRYWPSGAATTRSSLLKAHSPSPTTRPAPRSTCSTAATSCWKATWTPPPTSSAASWPGPWCRESSRDRGDQ